MKAIKIFVMLCISVFATQFLFAQAPVKKEKIEVNGNCGMCKKKIESSAKAAGALSANWNVKTKYLNVSYDPTVTDVMKIEEAIATSGYDTRDVKSSDSAYHNLEECCQYERQQTINSKKN